MQTEEIQKEIMIANEMDRITENLRHYLGESESELSLNIKKLTTNAKFVFSTLCLACEMQESISIDRILNIFNVLGETLHIKITKDILKNLGKIFGAYSNNMITLNQFFKNLRIHMKRLFPDFFNPISKETFDNIEMHENLLLNSQTFKNFIDEDEERDLAYTSFTIKSMYSRAKSGRPMTAKINQHDDQYNNLDDIPESKGDLIDKNGLLDKGNKGKTLQKNTSKDSKTATKEDNLKNTTKDLSTGEVNVNNDNENLHTDGNQNRSMSDKKTSERENLNTKELGGSPDKRGLNDSDNNVNFNSQEIRQGTAILSDSDKLPDEIRNDQYTDEKQTEEKLIQQTEDTVYYLNLS